MVGTETQHIREIKIPASLAQKESERCTNCLCMPICKNKTWYTIIRSCLPILMDVKNIFQQIDTTLEGQKDEGIIVYVKGIDICFFVEEEFNDNGSEVFGLCFGHLDRQFQKEMKDFVNKMDKRPGDYIFFRGWCLRFSKTLWIEFQK